MGVRVLWRTLIAAGAASLVLADSYPVVLTAHSPTLSYLPGTIRNGSTNPDALWNQTYTGVTSTADALALPNGGLGPGDQIGWAAGAGGDDAQRVQYAFSGTGIRFRGYWAAPGDPASAAAAVELIVDGRSTTATGSAGGTNELVTLAEDRALTNGRHDVRLVVRAGAVSILFVEPVLDFAGVAHETIAQGEAAALQQTSVGREVAGDGDTAPSIIYAAKALNASALEVNPALAVSGNGKDWEPLDRIKSVPYAAVATGVQNATLTAALGSGNVFLRVNGTVSTLCDGYTVSITPPPPDGMGTFAGNAHSFPWNGNATLYAAALDPRVTYTVSVQNTPAAGAGADMRVWVHSFELWKGRRISNSDTNGPNNTAVSNNTSTGNDPQSSGAHTTSGGNGGTDSASSGADTNVHSGGSGGKAHVGAIAGGVVGGILGLLLICILVICFVRKSRKQVKHDAAGNSDILGDAEHHAAHPYPQTTQTHAGIRPVHPGRPTRYESTLLSSAQQGGGLTETRDPTWTKGSWDRPYAVSETLLATTAMTETETGTSTSTVDGATTKMPSNSNGNAPRPATIVDQEVDAGGLVPLTDQPRRHVIPPRYDPSWASPASSSSPPLPHSAGGDGQRRGSVGRRALPRVPAGHVGDVKLGSKA